MSTQSDFDQLLDAWIAEGPSELPDRAVSRIVNAIDDSRKPSWLPRRETMNRLVLAAGSLAAVALIAVLGFGLAAGGGVFGPGATPSPSPTPTAAAGLPVGPHVMVSTDGLNEDRVTVIIPHSGWFAEPDQASLTRDLGGNNRVMVMTVPGDHYQIPENMCSWKGSRDLVPSNEPVGGLRGHDVTFLLGQQNYDTPEGLHRRDLSPEVDIDDIDGGSGRSVTGPVPDIDPSGCDEQRFCSLLDSGGNRCLLSHRAPGEIVTYWAMDHPRLNLWVVAAAYWPTTSSELLAEMNAIVDSMSAGGE
jgi:hypothetical protein